MAILLAQSDAVAFADQLIELWTRARAERRRSLISVTTYDGQCSFTAHLTSRDFYNPGYDDTPVKAMERLLAQLDEEPDSFDEADVRSACETLANIQISPDGRPAVSFLADFGRAPGQKIYTVQASNYSPGKPSLRSKATGSVLTKALVKALAKTQIL